MVEETFVTSPGQSKPYHHGDLWRALVAAGIAILHEEGVHALTLRSVARRAGVSHAAPYRHFADKGALLAAIAEDGYHRLLEGLADLLRHEDEDARAMLTEAGRRYVHFVLDNPDHVRIMFSGLLVDYERHPELCNVAQQSFAVLVELIVRAQRSGDLAVEDPIRQARAAWSMVHGLATLLMEHAFPPEMQQLPDVDQIAAYCITTLYQGLQASSRPD